MDDPALRTILSEVSSLGAFLGYNALRSLVEQEVFKKIGSKLTGYGNKSEKYLNKRGWTFESASDLVENPYTTRDAVDKATGSAATVFYNKAGDYIVTDNATGNLIQASEFGNVEWIPDSSIIDPYMPRKE